MDVDEVDQKILAVLAEDCRESYRRLASKVGVSPATLIQHIKRLEKERVILGYKADLDFSKLGYEFAAIVEITITKGALLEVQRKIARMPGVVSVYDVTGESDSVVVAKTKSRGDFSRLVKKILAMENVERTNTHVILNAVKEDNRIMPDLG
jgi:DNA-binding Lrp family transcriptional regulator